ncbi:HET-domain-containing protein [Byssothecium circinans]|uniref:HET-domain-containing protein n=1 Tax=Byssothecium circinans TaxID=147558 RepID=A0A6A5UBN0_9PLEO|nr:HET-domain-containing protein [Byssothecium circinans]
MLKKTPRSCQTQPRKRAREFEKTTSIGRPKKRQAQDSPCTGPSEQVASSSITGRIEEDKYLPESPGDEYIEKHFSVHAPYVHDAVRDAIRLLQEGRLYEWRRGGKDLYQSRLVQFQREYRSQGKAVRSLMIELWRLKDEWKYHIDNAFAVPFFKRIEQWAIESPCSKLCRRCRSVVAVQTPFPIAVEETTKSCPLCKILAPCHEGGINETESSLIDCRSPVRICAAPGFPALVEPEIRFQVLRQWLRVCDENHKELGCHLEASPQLPTRVLDVGGGTLRLHVSEPDDRGDYIALSHCWGDLSDAQKRLFCTSSDNIDSRRRGRDFNVAELPQTFQDAITVTRHLGKRYLWIDSLCIIQYSDDLQDWKTEAPRMAAVFRNAYCTIAATSAKDSTKGFLARQTTPSSKLQYVKLHTPSGTVFVSRVLDDYQGDVETGILNQRAWVLQERALSRRTIHFTAGQTYLECGDGVRCETLTRMRNSKALFLGDPKFPAFLIHRRARDKVNLFQHLFSLYSQLGLTVPTDRPIAISGLVDRLAESFQMTAMHGVFDGYLHRSLLWKRSGLVRMQRILYASDRKVPSWSWMAYTGQIEYVEIEHYRVEWAESVRLQEGVLKACVRGFEAWRIEQRDGDMCSMRKGRRDGAEGWLEFDREDIMDVRMLRCVVLGRDRMKQLLWTFLSQDVTGNGSCSRDTVGCYLKTNTWHVQRGIGHPNFSQLLHHEPRHDFEPNPKSQNHTTKMSHSQSPTTQQTSSQSQSQSQSQTPPKNHRPFPHMKGGCFCTKTRFRIDAPPLFCHACHCSDCQKQSGSVYGCSATVLTTDITCGSQPPKIDKTVRPSGQERSVASCELCGTVLWATGDMSPITTGVKVGVLDHPEIMEPDFHCFVENKIPWVILPEGARTGEGMLDFREVWPRASLRRFDEAIGKYEEGQKKEGKGKVDGEKETVGKEEKVVGEVDGRGEEESEEADKTPTAQSPEEEREDADDDDEEFERKARATELALLERLEKLTMKLENQKPGSAGGPPPSNNGQSDVRAV